MKQQGLTSVRTGKLEDNDAFKPLKYKIKSLTNTEADGKKWNCEKQQLFYN